MPKLCMTRTINLSNTQFRYQLVFFVHMYGYIWLAEAMFDVGEKLYSPVSPVACDVH